MINPAKPEIKAARPRTYTTLWDTILLISGSLVRAQVCPPFSMIWYRLARVARYFSIAQTFAAAEIDSNRSLGIRLLQISVVSSLV
ncbi:hypothetical protein FHS79_002433 [Polymorphobacter multimanifer]|uniref:Uncharacterized protein n=2 Tax=Polymorphobacter multimanifer TaxID=1070431 RepID=A0A841LGZ9_9SPHN|nr:hypothetical protein [Polymorphobacter multimanifer]